jgi:hypothetical protein
MHLVYIFDYRTVSGTVLPFRVPTFVARVICRVRPFLDYCPVAEGF